MSSISFFTDRCPYVYPFGPLAGKVCGQSVMKKDTKWCLVHEAIIQYDRNSPDHGPDTSSSPRPLQQSSETSNSSQNEETEKKSHKPKSSLKPFNFRGYSHELTDLFHSVPVFSEDIPLPYSAIHVFLNCERAMYIATCTEVAPECPIFQLAWLALNGMLNREMVPYSQITPDKDAYIRASEFLHTVRAGEEIRKLFEQYYAAQVYCNFPENDLMKIFQYFTRVTIVANVGGIDEFSTTYVVSFKERKVQKVSGLLKVPEDFDHLRGKIFEAIAEPDWFSIEFGPRQCIMYEVVGNIFFD